MLGVRENLTQNFTRSQYGFEPGTLGLLGGHSATELIFLEESTEKIFSYKYILKQVALFSSFSTDSRVTNSNQGPEFQNKCPYS